MKWLQEDLEDHQSRLVPWASAPPQGGTRVTLAGSRLDLYDQPSAGGPAHPSLSAHHPTPSPGGSCCLETEFFCVCYSFPPSGSKQKRNRALKLSALGVNNHRLTITRMSEKGGSDEKNDSSEDLLGENNNSHRRRTRLKQSNLNEKWELAEACRKWGRTHEGETTRARGSN